ncbi:MAG: phage shock protein operon transcriptional activator [Kangiellaceae bacterium]|nr:phage shock protein operon transcriptional activator [Kangiellaceae bacterium]
MKEPHDNLIGESSCFLEVQEHVSQLAPIDKPVLVIGERGTGKELIAARLHYLSSRWDQPFVKLNCSAINENLLETELFGHESGAFTGANKKHQGRFELADKGTLFLDEIGNSSKNVQEKLLRVIEYGEFERVGGNKTLKVDVRVVAATNEDLPSLARQGKFRADLLDRLAFDVITIPPLRHRAEDIMILARYFALEMTRELKRPFFAGFSQDAEQQLEAFPWPGNVRELKNVIERNIYKTAEDETVESIQFDPFDSPYRIGSDAGLIRNEKTSSIQNNSSPINGLDFASTSIQNELSSTNFEFPMDLKQTVSDLEIELLKSALKQSQYNQKKCADLIGLTYHQLRGYLKKYLLLDHK